MTEGFHSQAAEAWVTIAVLSRVWGTRGELTAIPFSSRPERYQSLRRVLLFGPDGPPGEKQALEIEFVREHRGRLVFKFRGIDSISEAERLKGAEVRIPLADRPEAPLGEFYHSDLLGCRVVDIETGEWLGGVAGFEDSGGPGLLVVEGHEPDNGILIPFARSICVDIDVKARRILVNLPEGLKGLNRP